MNGLLYQDYQYLYEQYCEISDNPIDRDLWIAVKWFYDISANAETRYLDPDLLIQKLLRENEVELLDVLDRGLQKARDLHMRL